MPHTCRTFESLATVRARLEARSLRIFNRPTRQAWANRFASTRAPMTDRVAEALRRATVTHRCAECKRWVTVTPQSFRPYATTGELTRTTAAERRALCERPVVLMVWQDAAGSSVEKILPKLPALGFDVRSHCGPNVRGPGQAPLDARGRRRQAPEQNPAAGGGGGSGMSTASAKEFLREHIEVVIVPARTQASDVL